MKLAKLCAFHLWLLVFVCVVASANLAAQDKSATVLTAAQIARVAPTGFYFEGQSAPTQMRNAAAVKIGEKRHVIAGIVDTSGYSSEIRQKYEGFFITDSTVSIAGKQLPIGAYGSGFTSDGKLNIFDVGGNQLLSVETANDKDLRRPRPLMMVSHSDGIRFYSGRSFAVVAAN